MATEERLLRCLENLKCTNVDIPQRNKERIASCLCMANIISNMQLLPNHLTGTVFEVLFQMCDDEDSDVRLVAEESINKIIKAMDDNFVTKVLFELHKEIKRNGPARSLRAALWRFSNLAHLIRLAKRKQYLVNSIPCIVHIAQRDEELVHETCKDSLPRILKSLGSFMSDGDVKTLLRAFLKNIDNPSTVLRRASINCLLVTCASCRRSHTFLLYLLDSLLDLLTSSRAAGIYLVLGVLGGLKQLMPYIKNMPNRQEIQGSFGIVKTMKEAKVDTEKLVQVYEICLHFLSCAHDSVVSASLDTLNSLLINCTPDTKNRLLSPDGIHNEKSLSLPLHLYLGGTTTTGIGANDGDNMLPLKNIRGKSFQDIDIGTFEDHNVPLMFCIRLVCKTCLLTGEKGGIIPDAKVRISVKNLALTCLVSLFELYPKGFLLHLPKSSAGAAAAAAAAATGQPITDILSLASHADPQIKGVLRIVVASFIKGVMIGSNGRYVSWFEEGSEIFSLNRLLHFLIEGLLDTSSSCVRQSLTGLSVCLRYILSSSSFQLAMPILQLLPAVMNNSHWLVKVKLLDVIAGIFQQQQQFLQIYSIGKHLQEGLVFGVVFKLLRDDDQRVRTAASNTIVRIVSSLYLPRRKTTAVAAIERIDMYFFETNWCDSLESSDDLPFPFNALSTSKRVVDVQIGLSKIVCELYRLLLENFADNAIYGYVEALYYLSLEYPTTVYSDAWHQSHRSSNLSDVIHSLLQQELIYDINCHVHVLHLCGNLLSARCVESLRGRDSDTNRRRLPWSMFAENRLQQMCDSFLGHLVKLLNILAHIIDDVPLVSDQKPTTTTTTTSITAAASSSPVKSRNSNDGNAEKKTDEGQPPEVGSEKKSEPTKAAQSHFRNSPHYLKIYDVVKVAYEKYKITLNLDGSENIIQLSSSVLTSLSQILEIATVTETSPIADEILGYLQAIFHLVPSLTVHNVHQLLKSLFGSNLAMSLFSSISARRTERKNNASNETHTLQQALLNRYRHENALHASTRWDSGRSGDDRGSPALPKLSRNLRELQRAPSKSDKMLAGYIRLFEPMVIKSLKHYTITSDVELQCAVLHLLDQLVRLKVNYCLLDSEQVFIKFIQRQFEFIEEGMIAQPAKLILKVFKFLTNLSHGKQHSKSIIDVPKVIQLCDGLMASGQSPVTYSIPALRPIVEELFLMRPNAADFEELETTREVLLSMLLRLFEYADVMDLLAAVLNENRRSGNTDKLSKWSKQVLDVFLAQLAGNKLKLDNRTAMLSMMKLLAALDPTVAQKELLVLLFRRFPTKDESDASVSSWLGKILTILLTIIRFEETALLKSIRESSGKFAPECVFDRVSVKSDPLNVTNVGTCFEALTPDTILVKFLFRVLELVSGKCLSVIANEEEGPTFLVEQLSHLLLILTYVFQAGNHRILVGCTIRLLGEQLNLENITANLVEVSIRVPPIAYQWCSILASLQCRSKCFWEMFIDADTMTTQCSFDDFETGKDSGCLHHRALPKTMASLALCEYLADNCTEPDELLSWFIARESLLATTWLSDEPPVSDVIRYIHENPQVDARFLHSISSIPTNNLQPHLQIKLASVLRDCHPDQTGRSIRFLVKNLLDRRHLALMRAVVNLTSRKLEYLLTLDNANIAKQLSEENVRDIINHIVVNDLARRNDTIVGLLTKVAHQVYNCDPVEQTFPSKSIVETTRLHTLQIDREWYLTQLTYGRNVASAFARIEVGDVTAMTDENSKRLVLRRVLSCADRFPTDGIGENPLVMKSLQVAFSDLLTFLRLLPRVHQVYLPEGRQTFNQEKTYATQIEDVFARKTAVWRDLQALLSVARDCAIFLKTYRPESRASMNLSILVRFCVVSLESILYTLTARRAPISVDHVEHVLKCVDEIFGSSNHLHVLGLDSHFSWLASSVNVLFKIVSWLCPRAKNDPPHLENYFFPPAAADDIRPVDEAHTIAKHAVCQLATVFKMIFVENRTVNVPELIRKTITSITMRLAKLTAFNSYLSTPPGIWKGNHPWTIDFGGPFRIQVPPLPVEFLRDADILEEYNFRISRLRWSNRQQFEETWMSLLSTLNSTLIEEDSESGHDPVIRFAIKAITSLLARTFDEPIWDDSNGDLIALFHVSRDDPIDATTANIRKLKCVQKKFERCFRNGETDFLRDSSLVLNVFDKPNVEKYENTRHSCGQVCVAYLLLSSGGVAEESISDHNLGEIYEKRRRSLERCGLDLNSCIQSLLDLYSLWLSSSSSSSSRRQNTRSPTVLDEILKSLLVISDLFQQRSQWMWLLDICVELSRDPALENEITFQYLLVAICKSVALLGPDMETYELVKKLLNQYIKSSDLVLRISCLYGLLYVIEGCVLTNTVIGGISEELQLFLPIATDYLSVQNNWNIIGAPIQHTSEHEIVTWALMFFLVENIPEECLPPGFATAAIQALIPMLKATRVPLNVYSSLMKALERMMVKKCLSTNLREHVTKLAVDQIKDGDASHSLFAVQLLLTCMYSDCLEDDANETANGGENANNPDDLVQIVEKLVVIFDRIRSSGVLFEVEILCQILPDVINDFFSPSDILTKVVGEFLSPQQKHPGPFAGVVFQVFENGIAKSHLTLLQDWVVVSLSNFAQTVSVGMATWYLTCFFVSTSTNFWLRSVFSHVRSRIGRLEAEDVEMLCVAGRDFYNNLTTDKQRQIFVEAFDKVELRCDTPFKDLLECIKGNSHV